jgi:hypothetical protein
MSRIAVRHDQSSGSHDNVPPPALLRMPPASSLPRRHVPRPIPSQRDRLHPAFDEKRSEEERGRRFGQS